MLKNVTFLLIAAFWVVMNVLLWRVAAGPGSDLVSGVPVRTVFEKILTAPDDSTLGIIVDGSKIGYLRWRPLVEDATATGQIASEAEPEGMVEQISEYNLELDGSFLLRQFERSIRIEANVSFNRSLKWQEFTAAGSMRLLKWEIKGSAPNQDLWLKTAAGDEEWIRRVTFDELRNPGPLLNELNLPIAPMLPAPLPGAAPGSTEPALQWTAYYDWLRIGRSRVRVYRIEGRLLESIRIVVLVSRVGEILKVELPGGVRLLNDALFVI